MNILNITDVLSELYPEAHCELNYKNPFELLIATILSAQSTDNQVNKVTPILFEKYPTPSDFVVAGEENIADIIRSLGLYRTKSKNIFKTCQLLCDVHNSEVPKDRIELEKFPGVGRKTAGVVLHNAFNIPAIAVDTHVHRVSNRLGLVETKDPLKTEVELMRILPEEKWGDVHHQLIWHGRRICIARNPKCSSCTLKSYCKYFKILSVESFTQTNNNRRV